jgi:hypothetical protein
MKSEHSKRLFGIGRHTAVMTNGALPLSRKGCTLGARLQFAELIFKTGTHFKLPFNIICEIQDRLRKYSLRTSCTVPEFRLSNKHCCCFSIVPNIFQLHSTQCLAKQLEFHSLQYSFYFNTRVNTCLHLPRKGSNTTAVHYSVLSDVSL